MTRFVVDTNVPIVANGRNDDNRGSRPYSPQCQRATIEFPQRLLREGRVLLDEEGRILEEYRRYLKPAGQPGVGDLFYKEILNNFSKVERHSLHCDENGEFLDLPEEVTQSRFDPSDRKFAALARQQNAKVANAVDSDWLEQEDLLTNNGVMVCFLCGRASNTWLSE